MTQPIKDLMDPKHALGAVIWLEAEYHQFNRLFLDNVNKRMADRGRPALPWPPKGFGTKEHRHGYLNMLRFRMPRLMK